MKVTVLRCCVLVAGGMALSCGAQEAPTIDALSMDRAAIDTPALITSGLAGAVLHALDVTINAAPVGTWEVLEHAGGYWVPSEAMQAWRLLMPAGARPVMHRQRLWWPLHSVPGYRAQFDDATQRLTLEVLSAAFAPTSLVTQAREPAAPSPALAALFINYDATWTQVRLRDSTPSDGGLLTEVGLSGAQGVLLSTQVTRWIDSGASSSTESRRLETHWTREWPQQGLRARVGDSWTRPSLWGRQAAFGGLQVGTSALPWRDGSGMATPLLGGSALTPSTVELYVNEALRQSVQVPAGPFTLENLAPLTGAGQARLVVRDVLGRETVIVRPFFTDPQLMAPGRMDWSAEAGWIRKGLGIGSVDDGYGQPFAQAWARRGIRNDLTLESRLQAASGLWRLDAAATASAFDRALLQFGAAGSSHEGRRGGSVLMGVQSLAAWGGVSARVVGSSAEFAEVGRLPLDRPARVEASGALRWALAEGHALGGSAATLQRHDGSKVVTGALSFSQRVAGWGQLLWSASRVQSAGPAAALASAVVRPASTTVQVMAVLPLQARGDGARPVVTAQLLRPRDAQGQASVDGVVTAHAPLSSDSEWGWRALAGRRAGQASMEGGLQWQAPQTLLGFDVSAIESQSTALRAQAQGAWVLTQGSLHAARRIQESFALVEVPGHAGVRVSLDGPALATTDAKGVALLPRLMPHQLNRVRLDPNRLPPESEIDTIELGVMPAWRSGVKVSFPVREGRAALVSVLVDGERPAPRGAVLVLEGEAREFVVGGRGEVYVTGLPPGQPRRASMNWEGRRCELEVVWQRGSLREPDQAELPRLGPVRCVERAR